MLCKLIGGLESSLIESDALEIFIAGVILNALEIFIGGLE